MSEYDSVNRWDACRRCPRMSLMWPPVADYSRPGDQPLEVRGFI